MLKTICLALRLCTTVSGSAWPLDGDTIAIEGVHVRLAGIDAEELNEPYGYMARLALKAIVEGKSVICHLNGKSHNRWVGTCFIGNTDIGAEMVRLGWALDCNRYSQGKYRTLEPDYIRTKLRQKPYC